ncbi:uncharacterized protein MYCFIDRAFT_212709 [Pseudocercospora fijiensis CIRAD86]|uniref:ribonuclease H n=1 Tax=Pseudocercospora fijiensis (strain CIRAD86) TaxID=383855 RepID=M3AJ10_PSEFD|nr:uncharacterized protein MYCFIDRAFT_212709 [Pseudocercospora fijiensis CIRAD86]EME77467.1 hypothetical protein MYCFIDRAFT_212709 [Pseudocercospora fijiensis CIRAD86]
MFTYDENYEEIRRLFVPSDDPGRRLIPRQDLVVYNTEKRISQLQFQAMAQSERSRDESSLVVHIDGACRNNGKPNARAAYGVYFGPDSPFNCAGLVPSTIPQTSTRAEIEALAHALEAVQRICNTDFKLCEIKIATDSSFVVDAMARWVEGWIANGGIGARGKRVAHYERLKELHEKLDYMEYSDDGGICVEFWHVSRDMNSEADALANAALDA